MGIGEDLRDVTEEICIRAVCGGCRGGDMPYYHAAGTGNDRWYHSSEQFDSSEGFDSPCGAAGIYELRRKRSTT